MAQAVHLPLVARRPDLFEIASLHDVSASTLAAVSDRYGGLERASLAQVLGDEPDALLLLTPGSHGADALAAAEAGVPVLCEKPLAYSLAEADALAAAEARLQVGYMKLYDPAVEAAVAARAGRPEPRSVEVTVVHPPSAPQLAHARVSPPPDDVSLETRGRLAAAAEGRLDDALGETAPAELRRLYEGVVLGSVVHDLSVVRALAGEVVSVERAYSWPDKLAPGSVAIEGTLAGGGRLAIRWHYFEHVASYREEVRVHDELGTVELVFPSPYLLHAPTGLTVTSPAPGGEETRGLRSTAEAFELQLEAFHRFVVEGAPPKAGIAEGRADIVTCQRIARRLAEERGWPFGGEAAA